MAVNNLACDKCVFQDKCVARNKLKPFLDDARTDLRVTLTFDNCADYQEVELDELEEE